MKRVNFVSLDSLTLQWFCNTLQTQHPQTQAAKELYDALEALYAGKSDSLMLDFDPSNPNPFSPEGSMRKVLLLQEVKLYAVVMRKPSGSSHTVTEFTIRSMIMRRYLSSSMRPPLNSVSQ